MSQAVTNPERRSGSEVSGPERSEFSTRDRVGLRRHLSGQLPVDTSRLWNARWAPWAIVLAVAATAFLLRWRPAPGADDVIWAEDGARFIQDELDHPTLGNLFRTYAGYVHVVPRLVSAVVTETPLSWWASGMSLAAVVIRVLCAAFVYRALAAHLHPPTRLAVAVVFVSLPLAGLETLDNVANLQWFLIPAAAAALIWRPQGRAGRLLATGLVLATSLSAPLALVLLPLALWRVAVVRGWREQGVTIALLLGGAVQTAAAFLSEGRVSQSSDPVEAVWNWLYRVVSSLPLGSDWAQDVLNSDRLGSINGTVALVATGGTVTILAMVGALLTPGPRRQLAVASILASSLVYGASTRFVDVDDLVDAMTGRAVLGLSGRYVVVSLLLLAPAVAAGLEAWTTKPRVGGAAHWCAAGFAAVYAVGVLQAYGQLVIQNTSAAWTDAAAAVSTGCASGEGTFNVAIEPINWIIVIPCSAVSSE